MNRKMENWIDFVLLPSLAIGILAGWLLYHFLPLLIAVIFE